MLSFAATFGLALLAGRGTRAACLLGSAAPCSVEAQAEPTNPELSQFDTELPDTELVDPGLAVGDEGLTPPPLLDAVELVTAPHDAMDLVSVGDDVCPAGRFLCTYGVNSHGDKMTICCAASQRCVQNVGCASSQDDGEASRAHYAMEVDAHDAMELATAGDDVCPAGRFLCKYGVNSHGDPMTICCAASQRCVQNVGCASSQAGLSVPSVEQSGPPQLFGEEEWPAPTLHDAVELDTARHAMEPAPQWCPRGTTLCAYGRGWTSCCMHSQRCVPHGYPHCVPKAGYPHDSMELDTAAHDAMEQATAGGDVCPAGRFLCTYGENSHGDKMTICCATSQRCVQNVGCASSLDDGAPSYAAI